MNELDELTDRLHQLGNRAPVPAADPLLDIRRGRSALRRRHACSAAGVTTALVAAGAVATTLPGLHLPGGGGGTSTVLAPAGSPSAPSPSSSSTAENPCTIEALSATGTTFGESVATSEGGDLPELGSENNAQVAAAIAAYQDAAAAILDPSGEHLDAADNQRSGGIQSGSYCDPKTGEHLTSLGTTIGWTSDGALGMIRIEVVSPAHEGQPQILLAHATWEHWRSTEPLPGGVINVRVSTYSEDGGGRAIVVERPDGLTVAIDAAGRWGNNAAPGSAPATDLPEIDKLVQLAASPALTIPTL